MKTNSLNSLELYCHSYIRWNRPSQPQALADCKLTHIHLDLRVFQKKMMPPLQEDTINLPLLSSQYQAQPICQEAYQPYWMTHT